MNKLTSRTKLMLRSEEAMPASHVRTLAAVSHPGPCQSTCKAEEDALSICGPIIHLGDPDGVLDYWLRHG